MLREQRFNVLCKVSRPWRFGKRRRNTTEKRRHEEREKKRSRFPASKLQTRKDPGLAVPLGDNSQYHSDEPARGDRAAVAVGSRANKYYRRAGGPMQVARHRP
ncbi:MAG TPA: hypothetical protein VHY91_23005 [Pirellulales bacterium]|nr:hypothetical protein [Pirellulales bacterium]